MWFEKLTGFKEKSPAQVRSNFDIFDNTITSKVNGKTMTCGYLETTSLTELRKRVLSNPEQSGKLVLSEVVDDVKRLHTDVSNTRALFQVASQFNLLEMVGPDVSPEKGVDGYENDPTQGPACAIAAGAGIIYRNYFVDVNGEMGQSSGHQIDCLKEFGILLGNTNESLWRMQNGYVLASKEGLTAITQLIDGMTGTELDELRQTLRIGIQWNTQVTLDDCKHLVTQAYCSALPVSYSRLPTDLWASFARLVLEASYEATLNVAAINYANTGCNKVYLTLLGGGAFGNKDEWIFLAIKRAINLFAHVDLDVTIVSYGASNHLVKNFIDSYSKGFVRV